MKSPSRRCFSPPMTRVTSQESNYSLMAVSRKYEAALCVSRMEVVMTSRSVVFAEPVRTAIGTFGGIGATAIDAAVARGSIRPDEVETVVMGNVVQAGTKMNPARQAAVHAGLPVTTPALTVNRVCGSG